MEGSVVSVNISEKKGTIKKPVGSGTLLADHGLLNDAHAEGGIRQVSLLGVESIEKMKQKGLEGLEYGMFAENITTKGIVLHKLAIGTVMNIGHTVLEVTKIGKECHGGCDIKKQTGHCVMPTEGIFAKVITGGVISENDAVIIPDQLQLL